MQQSLQQSIILISITSKNGYVRVAAMHLLSTEILPGRLIVVAVGRKLFLAVELLKVVTWLTSG